jgi:hypothetical protein
MTSVLIPSHLLLEIKLQELIFEVENQSFSTNRLFAPSNFHIRL